MVFTFGIICTVDFQASANASVIFWKISTTWLLNSDDHFIYLQLVFYNFEVYFVSPPVFPVLEKLDFDFLPV